jgi:hypothetical protein
MAVGSVGRTCRRAFARSSAALKSGHGSGVMFDPPPGVRLAPDRDEAARHAQGMERLGVARPGFESIPAQS